MSIAVLNGERDLTSLTLSTLKNSAGFWFLVAGVATWLILHAVAGNVLALAILGAAGLAGAALALWPARTLLSIEQMRRALGGPGPFVGHR